MRVSRFVTALTTLAAVVALSVHPGCSPSKTAEFSVDASGDVSTEAGESGPALDFDAQLDALLTSEAGFNDGHPDIDGMSCVADAGGPGPVQHLCVKFPANADDDN